MKIGNKALISLAGGAAMLAFGPSGQALETGDWLARIGGSHVDPDVSSRGFAQVDVDSVTQLSFTVARMVTDNLAVEVLAALPFKHAISLAGGGKVAEVEHLPPTVSLQYHFRPKAAVRPYLGVGINYTTFFGEETAGALAGADISLDDSWGPAAQIGVDYQLGPALFANADLRYVDIGTEADVSGLGTIDVDIDPWIYTLALGWRF